MSRPVEGAQSALRTLRLLKRVAISHPGGIALAELVKAEGLERTTTYRLLSSLVETGFVERDVHKTYRLGLESMQLGLAAMNRAPILELCRPMMQRLARRTEDTVFIVVRNGDYGHCLHYEEGAFPVRTLVLQVGGLRLLGIGSAGVALLATLAPAEVDALYARHREAFAQRGPGLQKLRQLTAAARRLGYSTSDDLVTEGVSGVGMSFQVTPGTHAAVSVGAITSRLPEQRRQWIAQIMAEEIAALRPTLPQAARPGEDSHTQSQ